METQLVVVKAVCNVEIVFDLHHFHGLFCLVQAARVSGKRLKYT